VTPQHPPPPARRPCICTSRTTTAPTPSTEKPWQTSPHRDHCCRILLELQDNIAPGTVEKEADRLLSLIGPDRGIPVLLHGEDTTCWPALRYAQRLGLPTQIGLEDTLTMPDGSSAPDNAALLRAAIRH
jgi:hypothetical protein